MVLKKMHWIGIVFGLLVILGGISVYFLTKDVNLLFFLIGIGATVVAFPFVAGIVFENKREQQINSMFLEFSRNLAEGVSTGTPVSKTIINMRNKNYGSLNPYIRKLANQIELGIPVERALHTFAQDIGSPIIKRAVALITEAEKAGGEIDYILESVAKSISEIDKLRKERKAVVYSLVVQGYIIFLIFIGIMLVMQFKILPMTEGIGSFGDISSIGSIKEIGSGDSPEIGGTQYVQSLGRSFLYLLLVQGFFAGLTIGKLSSGTIRDGIKHSFILMIMALLISTGANLFLGA